LQNHKSNAGQIVRVSAPDIETIVLKALRGHLNKASKDPGTDDKDNVLTPNDDRELIARHVQRVTIKPNEIEICGATATTTSEQEANRNIGVADKRSKRSKRRKRPVPFQINVPWTAPTFVAHKGIQHDPSSGSAMKPYARAAMLRAIGKARHWINDLIEGRAVSFNQIAADEDKDERHIRYLAQLAFVSPRIVTAIIDGSVLPNLTVTELAKALPYSWVEQERRVGLSNGQALR
jgi:hypothetical protein